MVNEILSQQIEARALKRMNAEEITQNLQKALDLLTEGRVVQGIKVLEEVGDFEPKTEEQVALLEYVAVMLIDDKS
jgi:hypothetical protein